MEASCLKSALEAVTQLCREEINKKVHSSMMKKQMQNINHEVEATVKAIGAEKSLAGAAQSLKKEDSQL